MQYKCVDIDTALSDTHGSSNCDRFAVLDWIYSILVQYMGPCWFLVVGILGLENSHGLVVLLLSGLMLALASGSLSRELLVPGVQNI